MKIPIPGNLISGPFGNESVILLEHLGSSAFGIVFKAKDNINNEIYAVKFPQFITFEDNLELTAFLNEVIAAREIQHPNVVKVLFVETKTTDLPPYLIMEYIDGGTLKSLLDSFRSNNTMVSLELLQNLTNNLIAGITAINKKMLHRDLKPDNILMVGDKPKISDFGLSKIVDSATRSKTFKGGQHIRYMAPEGWKFEVNKIQIDMYSMGIVLFEIASLQYPYELPKNQNDLDAFREMHLYQQPMSLQQLRPDLPVGFSQIISRLLEKNPDNRFSDWFQVNEALKKAWDYAKEENSPGKLMTTLLHETARLHEVNSRARLEEEKRVAEEKDQRRLDAFQQDRLLETINSTIIEFNEQSNLGKIEVQQKKTGNNIELLYRIPFGLILSLNFFSIDPPLKLSIGQVRFAAHLRDKEGYGLNLLLCREESDLYGKWNICRVKQRPSSTRKLIPEPFGFQSTDISEIERADHAMHIFTLDFSSDVEGAFLQVILDAMSRKK